MGIKASSNQEDAAEALKIIIKNILSQLKSQLEDSPKDLLIKTLNSLRNDSNALGRIYGGQKERERVENTLDAIIKEPTEFQIAEEIWQPVLDLFLKNDSKNHQRTSLWHIVEKAATDKTKPIVFLDIKGEGTTFADNEEIKALILREISITLKVAGEKAFKEDKKLNCLICLDEAHRFVKSSFGSDDSSEMSNLTRAFVDGVRTTRKYGLGYMFITQTIASLHKEIIQQLRLYAFGYGLTSGSEYRQIEELVSDKQALSLYKSFGFFSI